MQDWINSTVETLGVWGIAALMFLENIFPPIPSELIMPLAGFSASNGTMSLWSVIAAGVGGSLLGQYPLYYLGRSVGRRRLHRLADRYGKWAMVSGEDVDRAADWLHRHGAIAVFSCRMVPGLRSFISIPAGTGKMNLLVFTAYSVLGITIWSTLLAVVGYMLGSNHERISKFLGPAGTVIWVAIGLSVVGLVAWRYRACFMHSRSDCPMGQEGDGERDAGTEDGKVSE